MKNQKGLMHTHPELPDSMDKIFERYFTVQRLAATAVVPVSEILPTIDTQTGETRDLKYSSRLRQVWHRILREHGRYSCYAVYLLLPSDKEAIRYLTDFSKELEIITSTNCLAISLCTTSFEKDVNNEKWKIAVNEHVSHGYSAIVANLFKITFENFPSLIIFNDLRSSEHILVSLKGMTSEQIAEKMREIFSVVQNAVSDQKEPLAALEQHRAIESIKNNGNTTISELKKVAEKTFEKVVETWIKAAMKLD